MGNNKKYYQPFVYFDDGTNIEYGDMPQELYSFEVFESEEDCRNWLINNDYNPEDFAIIEYDEDDIEEPTILDEDETIIDIKQKN